MNSPLNENPKTNRGLCLCQETETREECPEIIGALARPFREGSDHRQALD